jgi:hypothetical protein
MCLPGIQILALTAKSTQTVPQAPRTQAGLLGPTPATILLANKSTC